MNFKFLNIPVQICPSFWLFLLFLTDIYQNPSIESVIVGVVVIMSLLVHEYGHALTAVYFGKKPEILLEAFGGSARYNSFGITPKQQFLITLNGPLFESVLIALSYYLLNVSFFENYYIRFFLYATLRINILWCLFNLIPIQPLDGGHLLHYLLEKKIGEKGCAYIGLACAAIIAPYLLFTGLYIFGTLLLIFGYQQFKKLSFSKANPFNLHMKGLESLRNNDFEEAKTHFKQLMKSKDAQMKTSAAEQLAKIYRQEHNPQLSYKTLLQCDPQYLKEGKPLLCQLAYEQGNYSLVCQYARDIYAIEPTQQTAHLNSRAFAHLKNPALAGAWLKTASLFENGQNLKELLADPSYDAVRTETTFQEQIS
jgi:stage IV sporulation protein FB